jgi:hypothetical protein
MEGLHYRKQCSKRPKDQDSKQTRARMHYIEDLEGQVQQTSASGQRYKGKGN